MEQVDFLALQFGFGLRETDPREFAQLLLATVALTTAVWLAVTMATRPEPEDTLLSFYRRVRPNAALWGPVAAKARPAARDRATWTRSSRSRCCA